MIVTTDDLRRRLLSPCLDGTLWTRLRSSSFSTNPCDFCRHTVLKRWDSVAQYDDYRWFYEAVGKATLDYVIESGLEELLDNPRNLLCKLEANE